MTCTNIHNSAEGIDPNDDDEKTARMKKRIQDQLAKLKRNAERRRQRQLAKQAALAENPVLGLIRGKREGAMVSFKTDNENLGLIHSLASLWQLWPTRTYENQ